MLEQSAKLSRSILLIPSQPHTALTTYDAKDPNTKFPPIEPLRPPIDAPNVLIILLAAMAGSINRGASTRNRPAAIQGFDSVHRASHLFADREIAAPQFFQRAKCVFPVVHRLELVGS